MPNKINDNTQVKNGNSTQPAKKQIAKADKLTAQQNFKFATKKNSKS